MREQVVWEGAGEREQVVREGAGREGAGGEQLVREQLTREQRLGNENCPHLYFCY